MAGASAVGLGQGWFRVSLDRVGFGLVYLGPRRLYARFSF